jgi:zinc/manganese transport system substrate-binding protein
LKKFIYILMAFIVMVAIGCNRSSITNQSQVDENKPKEREQYLNIITSNKLAFHMVKNIVGDRHMIRYMLKDEAEEWNFKYTEDSLSNVSRKDLFIYLGAGYEPWVHGFVEGLKKGKVGIVNLSRGIKIKELNNARMYEDMEIKENPYYWLNTDAYKIALLNIKNSIQERDPKSRDIYEENFNATIENLDNHTKEFKLLTENLKDYTFVTAEEDFDYFTEYINVKVVKIDGTDILQPDKLADKLEGHDKLAFLFSGGDILNQCAPIINQYNMKTVNIITYQFDKTVEDILKYNYESLYKLAFQ